MFQTEPVEIDWVISILLRRLWLILVCALLAAVMASAVVCGSACLRSDGRLACRIAARREFERVQRSHRRGTACADLWPIAEKPVVLAQAIERLNLPESPSSLAKRVKVETVANTQLIRITATDSEAVQPR